MPLLRVTVFDLKRQSALYSEALAGLTLFSPLLDSFHQLASTCGKSDKTSVWSA